MIPTLNFCADTWPGALIIFCGLDASGKTTLLNMLADDLQSQGVEPLITKQPTDAVRQSPLFQRVMYSGDFAQEIEYRSHSLITVSDRIQHSLRVILPALRSGRVVLSDRYFFSAVANLRARGYRDDRWIFELGDLLPRPDLAVFCDPPFEVIQERLRAREEERGRFFDIDFNRTLHEEFRNVAQAYPDALLLDTSAAPDKVYEELRTRVAGLDGSPLSSPDRAW